MPKVANQGGGGSYAELGPQAPFIAASAIAHGVDPKVALAVAYGEGGFNHPKPGDNNTSFGPFQLHEGGALPSVYDGRPKAADKWANSPQGIDYAVGRIAAVTRGMQGQAAIDAAVRDFERPANPNPEIQRDVGFYNQLVSGNATYTGSGGGNQVAGTTGTSGGIAQGSQAGVAPDVVPNVFANCQGTTTILYFIPAPSPGGITCYVVGAAKITMMALGGLVLMGVGFYMMLPRGRKNPLSAGSVGGVVGTGVDNLRTTGNPLKSGKLLRQQRIAGSQAEDIRLRQENLAQRTERIRIQQEQTAANAEYVTKVKAQKLGAERAKTSRLRAEAREARERAKRAKEGPGPAFLSPETELAIARVYEKGPKRPKSRPDRIS